MKTQKQLPELFYIQENKKTNEYCNKLGLKRNNPTTKDDYGDYLVFEDYESKDACFKSNLDYLILNYPKAVFIDLADYIEHSEEKTNTNSNDTFKTKPEEFKTLATTAPMNYYPILIQSKPYKILLSIQSQPKSEIIFKDKVITPEQLDQLLLSAKLFDEQKWQEKTRGGKEILGLQETIDGFWVVKTQYDVYLCLPNGINTGGNSNFDLIPLDPNAQRKSEMQAQINKLQEELNSLDK